MNKWSDKFNALPRDIRDIGYMCQTEMRINQLEMEKTRLIMRHHQSLNEINEHIKNLKQWIKDHEKE